MFLIRSFINFFLIGSLFININIFSKEAGMEASTTFALKALQKDQPMTMLTVSLMSLCVVLGIILRMFEM